MLAHLPAVRRAGEALLCRVGAQPQAERRLLHAGTGCTWGDLRWRLSCGAVLAVRGQGAPCHRCPSASSSSTCSRSSGMRTHTASEGRSTPAAKRSTEGFPHCYAVPKVSRRAQPCPLLGGAQLGRSTLPGYEISAPRGHVCHPRGRRFPAGPQPTPW